MTGQPSSTVIYEPITRSRAYMLIAAHDVAGIGNYDDRDVVTLCNGRVLTFWFAGARWEATDA